MWGTEPKTHKPIFPLIKDKINKEFDPKNITYVELNHISKGKPCFMLKNVLTPEECKLMINASESTGYQDAQEYCHMYRDRLNDRTMSDDDGFTDFIYNRVKSYLPKTLTIGFNNTLWDLDDLNTRWRYCRYVRGHYFGKHSDGRYTKTMSYQSHLTFMLYLNGPQDKSFAGGSTNFVDRMGKPKYEIVPEPGLALVFLQADSDLLHEGAKLRDGTKYILRTDVMYKFRAPDRKPKK
mmetsp:Transcript_13837/g.15269  ORF Transcript_13837/g.15269 Transcript_13837/m.15269 type:complete len:237 (-) Transcript_13837:40-750(-)